MQKEEDIRRGRILAIVIVILQAAICCAYGFGGELLHPTNYDPSQLLLYCFPALLALLGYGMLLSYWGRGTALGMTTTLLVVGISVQLAPLWQKIWYAVFHSFTVDLADATSGFHYYFQGTMLKYSLFTERLTMVMVSSLLLAFTGFVGKLAAIETLAVSLVFIVGWNFNFMASAHLAESKGLTAIFDDFGTNYIYLFGSSFGVVLSLILGCNQQEDKRQTKRHNSSLFFSLIGTAFIFCTFPFTGILYPDLPSSTSSVVHIFRGPLNIYFAMTSSVICTYASSFLFGKGMTGLRESLIGTISGGFSIAAVSGVQPNIGACIAIGAFSGCLSGFWLRIVHPRINRTHQIDSLGLFGPIFLNSFLGGVVVSPLTAVILGQKGTLSPPNDMSASTMALYQLSYAGIAIGSGLFSGFLASIFAFFCWRRQDNFLNSKMISEDFGLYVKPKEVQPQQSAKTLLPVTL